MRGYDPSRLLLRGHTHRRAFGQQSRGEALSLGETLDFERDRVDRLRERGDIPVQADVGRRKNLLDGLPCGASRPELCPRPGSDESNERRETAGDTEKNYVVLAQGSEKNRRHN